MTPEEYEVIQELFLELRTLSSPEVLERLGQLETDGHPNVQLLRELLVADEPSTFLESPLASVEAFASDNSNLRKEIAGSVESTKAAPLDSRKQESLPDKIGPYRILQKIGEGGHGLVFMAEQRSPIRRKVAIKLIKPGMQSKMILARFAAERQALALMKHPSIANVIDAGTSDTGTPYFAMELVHGTPIDKFCLENQLSLDATLDLFCQVCDAVHHAHRKGIIHRDLKPANILVTLDSGKPLAKVIDFGIAKAMHLSLTDKTMFTEYGQIVGTLEYMSPEQAMLSQDDADVRSDVYSLGVILYLLLTGTTPISKQKLLEQGLFELKNVLNNFRPPTPSLRLTSTSAAQTWKQMSERDHKNWHSSLKGDLDWITMKAISKELDIRYDSAAALQDDVVNYLNGQPVVARPPSLAYRASKWINRNRIAAFFLCCFFTSLAVSLVSLSWGAYQARKNLGQVKKAQELLLEKAVVLESSLKETRRERERADKNASKLALISKKGLLESAWSLSRDGNSLAAKEKLNLISVEYRDYLWHLVNLATQQQDSVIFRQTDRGAVRETAIHSATGKLAVVTADSRLEIWSTTEKTLELEASIPKALYNCLSFSRNGQKLLIGASGWVIEYDIVKKECSDRLIHAKGGTRCAVSDESSNNWLITTGANFLLEVDLDKQVVRNSLRLPNRINRLELDASGKWAAIASIDGPIFLVGTNKFEIFETVKGLTAEALELRWNENFLLACDLYGATHQIEPAQLSTSRASTEAHVTNVIARFRRDAANDVALHNESVYLVDRNGQLYFGDKYQTNLRISTSQTAIASILANSDQAELYLVRYDGRIDEISRSTIQRQVLFSKHLQTLTDGVGLPESEIFVSGHHNGNVHKIDRDSGLTLVESKVHEAGVLSLEVWNKANTVVSLGADWMLCLSSLDSLELKSQRKIALGVRDVALSCSGEFFASAADLDSDDDIIEGTIDLWETSTGSAIRRFSGHTNWVTQLKFSQDDQWLYSLSLDASIRQWCVRDAANRLTIDLSNDSNVTVFDLIESDDRIICGHEDGSISLKNTVDGKPVSNSQIFFNSVNSLVVPVDSGIAFATSAESNFIACIDNRSLEVVCRLKMNTDRILALKFDRAGQSLNILNSNGDIHSIDLGKVASSQESAHNIEGRGALE